MNTKDSNSWIGRDEEGNLNYLSREKFRYLKRLKPSAYYKKYHITKENSNANCRGMVRAARRREKS
jgi:hypothetical protein